jgi:hypothetical protein
MGIRALKYVISCNKQYKYACTAVVNKLFSQKVSPAIVLKWKQEEDLTSYLTENQSQSVNKEIQTQTYQKGDSVNHVE